MKKLLVVIFAILFFQSCFEANRNCVDFKNGNFIFNYTINGEEKEGRFTRNDTLNIDYFEGQIDSASVRWINDCEYIMVKLHPKTKQEERAIHMKIISTTDDSYTFEYNFVGNSLKQRGTAKKVK